MSPSKAQDKSKIYIVLDLGQSNADGRAQIDRLLASSAPYRVDPDNCKIFYKSVFSATSTGSWQNLVLGTNNLNPALSQDYFAAEASLAPNISKRVNEIHYIKCTLGNTALGPDPTREDWDPATNELFDYATLGYFDKAISFYQDREIEVLAILWHQGEADAAKGGDYVTNYSTRFSDFWTQVRAHNALLSSCPIIITKLNYSLSVNEGTINTVFDNYAAVGANNAYTVDISDLPRKSDLTTGEKLGITGINDDWHQSYIAQVVKGERIYNQLASINGWPSITESF